MRLLLDTQAVLWFWWNDSQLTTTALQLICDPGNQKLVSTATPWEIAIKVSLKKLDIGGPYQGFFPQHMLRNKFEWLFSTDAHLSALVDLPFHHRDPFDRLIIAQASVEQIPIVSADPQFDAYPVRRLW
jgi:PIN domain nuclease of toxin-antitoxin system